MSTLKSVIITLPKGLSKAIPADELASLPAASGLNFVASLLTDKANMENARKMTVRQQEEAHDDGVTALVKPADGCGRGKKRRLDHLTWEEKLQRKKLKNRMAAQTSRDRKKAKLDELVDTVKSLKDRNDLLTQECAMLRTQNESLLSETKRLVRDRDTRSINGDQQQYCSMCQARVGCAVPSLGSAVSPDPLPQGGTVQPAPCLTPEAAILLKFLTICLLSKTCSASSKVTTSKVTTSTASTGSRNWPKAFCKNLPARWKRILLEMNKSPSRKIPLKNLTIQKQWWGRHQKMWKPIELIEA